MEVLEKKSSTEIQLLFHEDKALMPRACDSAMKFSSGMNVRVPHFSSAVYIAPNQEIRCFKYAAVF